RGSLSPRLYPQLLVIKDITSRQTVGLKRTQEMQDVLFLGLWQVLERLDDRVCFGGVTSAGAAALMRLNRLEQVRGAAVMEKKKPPAYPPQGSGAELARASLPLRDPIGQAWPHVMEQQIGEEIDGLIAQRLDGRVACVEGRGVTERAPDVAKQALAAGDRLGATWGVESRGRWGEEAHKEREFLDGAERLQGRHGVGVGHVVRHRRELARRVFLALRLKQFVGDAHFDVVGFAGEQEERLDLGFPAKARDGAVIAVEVRLAG